jgi:NAD(P)H-hydrate epimerase
LSPEFSQEELETMKVATVEEMRELDRHAITQYGIPDHLLMENAGEAVYYAILQDFGVRDREFAVICGLGNNGGDGFVVARKIHSTGGRVRVLVLGDPEKYGETSRTHFEMLAKSGAPISSQPPLEEVEEAIEECDALVDAIFGTGITRDVEGRYRDIIDRINQSGKTVFSIDIPSGVDGNNGTVRGTAVRADVTVTFGLPKRGNLLYPGAELGGRLLLTHISFPPPLQSDDCILAAINQPPPLPPRPDDGHKGSYGDTLFVAGAAGYIGAPAFAALSMLKAGGGYSRLAAPRSTIPAIAAIAPEVVFAPQQETAAGSLASGAAGALLELSRAVDFVVIGPGLSLADETQELVRELASKVEKPLLIDGDGLSAISVDAEVVKRRQGATVLTPHAGEMSRISGKSIEQILDDPFAAVQAVTRELGAVVVLKGAHSLIGLPDGRVYVNPSGNSGMATAGSGDILTGTIAAMYGLGLPLEGAVRAGVFLHGFAGDVAATDKGPDGITARDILDSLPAATRSYREEFAEVTSDFYGALEVI